MNAEKAREPLGIILETLFKEFENQVVVASYPWEDYLYIYIVKKIGDAKVVGFESDNRWLTHDLSNGVLLTFPYNTVDSLISDGNLEGVLRDSIQRVLTI